MTANQNHANLNVFVYGEQVIDSAFHLRDMDPRGGYGVLGIPGEVCDLTLFIHTPEQARAIAAAAAEIAAQFPPAERVSCQLCSYLAHGGAVGGLPGCTDNDGCTAAADRGGACPCQSEQAHECGTAPEGAPDPGTYPARVFVLQRDPADPESWVFRCSEEHGADGSDCPGWQSPDYASEDDALIAASDHARAMHDMALPAAVAERAAAAARTFAGQ